MAVPGYYTTIHHEMETVWKQLQCFFIQNFCTSGSFVCIIFVFTVEHCAVSIHFAPNISANVLFCALSIFGFWLVARGSVARFNRFILLIF